MFKIKFLGKYILISAFVISMVFDCFLSNSLIFAVFCARTLRMFNKTYYVLRLNRKLFFSLNSKITKMVGDFIRCIQIKKKCEINKIYTWKTNLKASWRMFVGMTRYTADK